MTLSVIGPLNNLWGPGLSFDVADSGSGVPSFNETYNVFFYVGTVLTLDQVVGVAQAFVTSDHQSSLMIGGTATPQNRFRSGASAGMEVHLSIHRTLSNGADAEPPQIVGPVSWDPALQLQVLAQVWRGSGGGLTPEQAQMLEDIFNSVAKVYRNAP